MAFALRHHRTFEQLEPRKLLAGDITLVRYFDLWDGGIIPSTDVAGITYHAPSGHLFISDSEINELNNIFDGNNVFEISLAGDELFQSFVTNNNEPTGITYSEDAQGVGSFFVTNDNTPKHFARYDETFSGPLDTIYTTDDVPTASDPEGITNDPLTGDLYIVDGNGGGIQVLVYDANLAFQRVFTLADRISDCEGIAFDPQSRHLFVVSGSDRIICEYTLDGHYLEQYDISPFVTAPTSAQALTFGPTSDPNDDPSRLALYIADGGEDNFPDGRVYETLLPDLTGNRAPVLDLIDLQSVAVGEELAFTVTAYEHDMPGDTLTFSLDPGSPPTATIDPETGDFRWTPQSVGDYSVTVRVTDDGSPNLSDTEDIRIIVYDASTQFGTLERRIAVGTDDAEQRPDGKINLTSADLELVYDKGDQLVGLRFDAMTIPQGASILSAYVQFQVDETSSGYTDLIIRAEDIDNAEAFTRTNDGLSSRTMTDEYVVWSPPEWDTIGMAGQGQRTPSLMTVVQEVVDRTGWSMGNAMVLLISGTGDRVAESYDGDTSGAPLLHVEYMKTNLAPAADDDTATTIEETPVTTDVLTNDDLGDLPTTITAVTQGTNGTVTFDATAGTTTYLPGAGFAGSDSYTYTITDVDGDASSATVSVTVNPVAPTSTVFAVIGDYGIDRPSEAGVADLVKSWDPEFVITTGDNNYPDGEASTIDHTIGQYYHEFIDPYLGNYGEGADTNRFFPSLGNHDWNTPDAQPHFDYFTLPGNERYYSVAWGPVEVFAIDSDLHEVDGHTSDSIQGAWLQNALAESTATWKLVYMHHPPYSSAERGT
ncbi:MAG TPA: Ig-like domain-containing protein, partial [Thermoguttaceae bacterium]|nr:Ig-like domain-containing protein [Thermoguttaceae bacterium]